MAEPCNVPVILTTPSGDAYNILLTAADAERCANDMQFATTVLGIAMGGFPGKEPQTVPCVQPGPSSASSSSSSSHTPVDTEDEGSTAFKWPHAAVLLLVETYMVHEGDLTNGKMSQKKVWEKISRVLGEHGHMVTGPQCMSKFNGMKRTYKGISNHNSKSGNNPRTWPYFELMQSLLGERPFIEPLAIASSSSPRPRTHSESSIERSNDDASPSPCGSRSRKRRAGDDMCALSAAILESRRIAEDNKNRRHMEKLAKKDVLISKLDALLEKL